MSLFRSPLRSLLRQPLLHLSRSDRVKRLVTTVPATSALVGRYVAGETVPDAVRVTAELVDAGLRVTLDHLGEDVLDVETAERNVAATTEVLRELATRSLTRQAEVSVKLSAIGLALPDHGDKIALENARAICRAARNAGTSVTVDMEDHTTTDATLAILRELRKDFPETGAVLQAALRRTEEDCRSLAHEGSRVRLCKAAYLEPEEVAFTDPHDIDRSFVRCLKVLMAGQGHPMVATHDPRMVEIACSLASHYDRPQGSYEFQMLYGIRPTEQRRLASVGEDVRVYVPYGTEWYGYLMRRLAERPANLALFATSLVSRT